MILFYKLVMNAGYGKLRNEPGRFYGLYNSCLGTIGRTILNIN